jgi:acyl carrier protein
LQWNSFGQFVLALEHKREFDLELSPEQREQLKSGAAIIELTLALG